MGKKNTHNVKNSIMIALLIVLSRIELAQIKLMAKPGAAL